MDYLYLIHQECPIGMYQSAVQIQSEMQPVDETILFWHFTDFRSLPPPKCFYGIVGHLSQEMSPKWSDEFKMHSLGTIHQFKIYAQRYGDEAAQIELKSNVSDALHSIMDDVTKPHLQGTILAVAMGFNIDLRIEIDKRINYKSSTLRGVSDWIFNEYATCMGDEEGPQRLAKLFAKSDAQFLRNTFTQIIYQHARGDYCIQENIIAELVQPYLKDTRKTNDVNDFGPPVSHYARELFDAVVKK